jgi:hypothetical protein
VLVTRYSSRRPKLSWLRRASPEPTERTVTTPLRMKLVDSSPAPRVSQSDELPGKSNYIIGSDRRNWHTQVPRYGKVKYEDVHPGVDLVYYGNQQQLEYDFIVSPGADPDVIELAFEGAQSLRVDDAGDLLLDIGDGEVRLKTPLIYQETDGGRVQIPGGYRKTGSDRVAFHRSGDFARDADQHGRRVERRDRSEQCQQHSDVRDQSQHTPDRQCRSGPDRVRRNQLSGDGDAERVPARVIPTGTR